MALLNLKLLRQVEERKQNEMKFYVPMPLLRENFSQLTN